MDRFYAKVAPMMDDRGCWEWTGCKTVRGYGLFWLGKKLAVAHRAAYELLVGPIPEKLTLDHLCRNTSCVNPRHLEAVTNKVNNARGNSPSARNARMTECRKGHPLEGSNVYIYDNERHCRKCRADWARDRRQAQRLQGAA